MLTGSGVRYRFSGMSKWTFRAMGERSGTREGRSFCYHERPGARGRFFSYMEIFKARRAAFQKLHEDGCFVIPNPWDIGTARDLMLGHIAEIVAAVEAPVNADFRAGYADQPEDVAENVRLCIDTGVAGLSIEDATEDVRNPLYDVALA